PPPPGNAPGPLAVFQSNRTQRCLQQSSPFNTLSFTRLRSEFGSGATAPASDTVNCSLSTVFLPPHIFAEQQLQLFLCCGGNRIRLRQHCELRRRSACACPFARHCSHRS